ncbi:MAG: porin, partial [Burkholderiales bacterium]
MKKALLSLLVASAVVSIGTAHADTSFVDIYGRLNVDFESVKASGSTGAANDIPSRNRVSNNTSYIGFRGSEELLSGVRAIFQIESAVAVDSATVSATSGIFASRNSNVGLASKTLGTVFYGVWETPYKLTTKVLDPFYGISIFSAYRAIFGSPGGNVNSTPTGSATTGGSSAAGFGRRENNSIQYWSPNFNGLSGRIAYEANEGRSNTSAGNTVNPYLWSAAATYDKGPYDLSVGYERHRDFLVTTAATPVAAFPLG